ncbi:ectoine/hydroxyectoine ABC transporter substrate-binding protein EhuB [Paenactinomyces guangxiensis]|uniref:Ectoine/hydroxyectoine ABC transporter substrate-binding protein EhuB n=2 Tax=Paenactinomyces guangxiensis TaxID=1490290 RepID=A0A7W1WRQ6_9BACL|nr:ectoine/hydroxyectoine ABC transporter substrate-binding protein EhuB [Paenactinomyces guangxiensis]MBH8591735.1 ectoine/hydroxyectoine ABC transporter substrate-binding protein EhuB [Paenactinomyces guangxiensis]
MVFVLLLSVSLTACGGLDFGSSMNDTLKRAKEEGVVKVGFANEKPYAYKDESGKVTGEAVEVARTVFENMGINKIEPVLVEFGSLIPGLKSGRFDVITAGMYITPERCKEVAFANPEYTIGEAIAVKKGNPKNLHSYEDIAANPKVKVGVMKGAVEVGYLKKLGVKDNQIVIVPDQPSAISALASGRVDTITMTGPSLRAMIESTGSKNIEEVKDFKEPVIDGKSVRGYGAAAFRKDNEKFRDAFNQELAKMKKSGALLEAIQPFGFNEENLPGDKTAEELCKQQ